MNTETPDIMVDLETFGTRPGSVFASIGAVAFNASTGLLGAQFYSTVDVRSCEHLGLTLDAETVLWWLRQSGEARDAITAPGAIPLMSALQGFTSFFVRNGGRCLWGHGGNFDEPMLCAAYRACGLKTPWEFYQARCTRTLFELADVKPSRAGGVHHNALDDAFAQAEAAIHAFQRLGLAQASDAAE